MSTLDYRDIPGDRLATTDKDGGRMWIIPARVRGQWKNRKRIFHIVLLFIFSFTPWLRWNGEPLVLMDLMERRFVFFGEIFSAHDAPYIFFVLGILSFVLILVTALWGRVWCGWACPQTVFIEQVFRRIESLVVGNRAEQIKCSKDPLKLKNFTKLFAKWFLFIFMSLFLAHTFIAYFVSWERLMIMMAQPPSESWVVFVIIMSLSALILFNFAWFREQFCIIMCPYGRFQSVLMDQNSLTVTYDHKRGEPKARNIKAKSQDGAGDCIDCYKCVSVCPTGIDIRAGQQLECIACTACMDACDEVMVKINRSKGLIRYASLNEIEGKVKKLLQPRVFVYLAVIVLFIAGFVYSLNQHREFYFTILRQNQKPYAVSMDGGREIVINNFRIHLRNPSKEKMRVELRLLDNAEVIMLPPILKVDLESREDRHLPFFLKFSEEFWSSIESKKVSIEVKYGDDDGSKIIERLTLVGPQS